MGKQYPVRELGRFMCLASAMIMAHCESPGDAGTSESTASSLTEFSAAYTDALCGFLLGCCPDGFQDNDLDIVYPIANEAECREHFNRYASMDDSRLAWDAEKAEACIVAVRDRIGELTCDTTVNGVEYAVLDVVDACETFYTGVQTEAQDCAADDECEPGLLCSSRADFSNFHKCYMPAKEGESCSGENQACDYTQGFFCSTEAGICRGTAAEGEDCTTRFCAGYTYCTEENICAPLKAENEPCTTTTECAPRLVCDNLCVSDGTPNDDVDAYAQPNLSESCVWL